MFGRRIELFKLFGFAIRVDPSWLILAVLVTWSFASQVYPEVHADLPVRTYWAMGLATALGLFLSVILHELSHALVARHYGMEMRGITLFLFGGVAEMDDEPPSAEAELMMAAAGPAASLWIAGALGLASFWGATSGWSAGLTTVVGNLAIVNLMLVLFNLLPAFPLDGGRVLRAVLWHLKGDLRGSTRITSRIGRAFGIGLMVLGGAAVLSGSFMQGIWLFLIGMFLRGAARMSYQQLLLRSALEGEPVARFMQRDPVVVPRSISVAQLVEDYIYRHQLKMFPVVDGERLVGCVNTQDIRHLPREEWTRQTVGTVTEQCGPRNTVRPETDAGQALTLMNKGHTSRLMVVDGDHLLGILTLRDLLKFFSLKMELESLAHRGEA